MHVKKDGYSMALGFVEGVRIRGLIVFVVEAEIDDGLLEAIDAQARFTACDDEPIGGDAELLADGGRLLALLRTWRVCPPW